LKSEREFVWNSQILHTREAEHLFQELHTKVDS